MSAARRCRRCARFTPAADYRRPWCPRCEDVLDLERGPGGVQVEGLPQAEADAYLAGLGPAPEDRP